MKILKSTLQKRERRKIKRELKEALEQWRNNVKTRDNYRCVIDNKEFPPSILNAHHILPNTPKYKAYKTDINNGLTLCPYHHRLGPDAAHNNCLFLSNWLKQNRPEQYEYLMKVCIELNAFIIK